MGRRGSSAPFKPGVYVFPGGVTERTDFMVRPRNSLSSGIAQHLAVANSQRFANALAMTAIRETFEETGLLFGSPDGDIGPVDHQSWKIFREKQLSPDLRLLDYLGRAITPSDQHLRFHARFFATSHQNLQGTLTTDEELEDLDWVKLSGPHEKEMMIVQKAMLAILAKSLSGARTAPARLIFNRRRKNRVKTV
mgnify:CR=1 FL=1